MSAACEAKSHIEDIIDLRPKTSLKDHFWTIANAIGVTPRRVRSLHAVDVAEPRASELDALRVYAAKENKKAAERHAARLERSAAALERIDADFHRAEAAGLRSAARDLRDMA